MKTTPTVWMIWGIELAIVLLTTVFGYLAISEGMVSTFTYLLLFVIVTLTITVVDAFLLGRDGIIRQQSG